MLLDRHFNKKNSHEKLQAAGLPESLSKPILNIRKEFDFNKMVSKNLQVQDIPHQFWAGFDAFLVSNGQQQIPFEEYAENKSNFEYLKEFNQLNGENKAYLTLVSSETGDQVQVNKGFLSNLLDDDDQANLSAGNQEENKYAFLADEMGADEGEDFYDPAALLRRQRILLSKI